MASWVQIANKALRRLGSATIQSLDEDSEPARAVKEVYEMVRDEVLAQHPWNCALTRAQLAAESTAPKFGYTHKFKLPTDPYCLRVWRLEDTTIEHKIEVRVILADGAGPLNILYIARVTDPELFSAWVATAIAAQIAAELAYRLTNSTSKEEAMRDWAEKELKRARSSDAQEGTPEPVEADEFLNARI